MNNKVKAIIAQSKGLPVLTEEILVPDPGPGEALVKIQACGVCHTDLHYREGAINDEFPFLLGHEASFGDFYWVTFLLGYVFCYWITFLVFGYFWMFF